MLYGQGDVDVRSFKIDLGSGRLTQDQTIASGSSTTTLLTGAVATDPANYLYAIDPTDNGVEAYSVGSDGTLTTIGGSPFQLPATLVSASVSISGLAVTPKGTALYAMNGIDELITGYQVTSGTGALTLMPGELNTGELTWPQQGIVDPSGQFLYVSSTIINAEDASVDTLSGVLGYSIDPTTGNLSPLPNSPYQMVANGQPTQLVFDPTGRFLYTVLTAANSIAGFVKDSATGVLTPIPGSPFLSESGSNPQTTAIDVHPSGQFLYAFNWNAGNISVFSIDSSTGVLSPAAGPYATPSAEGTMKIDPSGKYLYLTAYGTGQSSGFIDSMLIYSVNPTTGALKQISGSPFTMPESIYSFIIVQTP